MEHARKNGIDIKPDMFFPAFWEEFEVVATKELRRRTRQTNSGEEGADVPHTQNVRPDSVPVYRNVRA